MAQKIIILSKHNDLRTRAIFHDNGELELRHEMLTVMDDKCVVRKKWIAHRVVRKKWIAHRFLTLDKNEFSKLCKAGKEIQHD